MQKEITQRLIGVLVAVSPFLLFTVPCLIAETRETGMPDNYVVAGKRGPGNL